MIVNSDNLIFMKTLPSSSINLIYCDILYGTGKKFKDYTDLKTDKQTVFDFYTPRFEEMKRLLCHDGTIFLQMGIHINHWIRLLMDDIFGQKNFRNQIVVSYNIGGRGKREFAKKYDILLQYSKSDTFIFNDKAIRVPYKSVVSKKGRLNITPDKLAEGTIPTNVWADIPSGLKVKKITDYFSEKHPKILERIILACSNENDTVADFFCGSGTTAFVASKLNRKIICCDINPKAIELTKKWEQ
jgi:site-specific DNA-methyltransferase (adenine-specific)